MSNRIVPMVYRQIVDDVMTNIRSEFEEFGVGDQVLQDLQTRWEVKIMNSNVADFEPGSGSKDKEKEKAPTSSASQPGGYPSPASGAGPSSFTSTFQLPSLATPPKLSAYPSRGASPLSGFDPLTGTSHVKTEPLMRIPQLDGPSALSSQEDSDGASSDGDTSPVTKPVPLPSVAPEALTMPDDDEIGSDLDDSEDEDDVADDEGDLENTYKVLCTHDKKVHRVKNKWKCSLRDGMIHLNGKDYLFSRCNGEFEW